jgi:hypothetical protein
VTNDLLTHAALRACRTFLVPVVRFLMRCGIDYAAFAEQARWAFVQVATADYGLRGRATNASRVALITGISRKEVTRLRSISDDGVDPVATWWRRLGDILQRWHTDPDFVDARGVPLDLPLEGRHGLAELVKRYGGQMSVASVVRELRRLGCVQELPDGRIRVLARSLVTHGGDVESIHHFGETLANVAATMAHNFAPENAGAQLLEKFVWADGLDNAARVRFQRISAEQGYKFLEVMDDWLSSNCDPALVGDEQSLSLGVGVYYFEKRTREPTARSSGD